MGDTQPILYIFSGLPASGKSTLAQELAKVTKATYVRIDTIEQSLKNTGGQESIITSEGYKIAYEVTKDNLLVGNCVIADSVNPLRLTRDQWNQVAISVEAKFINIEILCSDIEEHRNRVESRNIEVKNLVAPTWKEIREREYHQWHVSKLQVDTATQTIEQSFLQLLAKIKNYDDISKTRGV